MNFFKSLHDAYPQSQRHQVVLKGLALLLLAMSIGQLASFATFVEIIELYSVGNPLIVSVALLVFQLLSVPALLSLRLSPAMSVLSRYSVIIIPLLWSILAFQAIIRGIAIDNCGCFGSYLSQPLSASVVYQDLVFSVWGMYSFFLIRYKQVQW